MGLLGHMNPLAEFEINALVYVKIFKSRQKRLAKL